jgi:RNA polymerase sigma-70 factor, ECF subfamily
LAEDLLSDVFLDVWRQAAKFKARSSVSTWLLAIARYKALSARRRRIDAELDQEVSVIIADPANNPELVLQKKNQAELVRHSLARLSPEHGEVIDLVYYHGKSVREVAEIVGIATATVKTRMFYARKPVRHRKTWQLHRTPVENDATCERNRTWIHHWLDQAWPRRNASFQADPQSSGGCRIKP